MNDLQKVIDRAFKTLSVIPVCGDHADLMAAAREDLRTAYRLAAGEQEAADG